nr:hypothetical protein [Marinicella sp. W31]MDC2877022.1 hypothetical protein [Marinicella sp. W31]
MTDMTVSFLFIVLILLAFFATQVAPQEKDQVVPRTIHDAALDQLAERQREIVLLKNEVERLRRLVPQSTDTNPIETYNTNVAASRGNCFAKSRARSKARILTSKLPLAATWTPYNSRAMGFCGEQFRTFFGWARTDGRSGENTDR